MSFQALWLVASGGALGAVGRYGVGLWLKTGSGFPWATLSVNLLGSLLLGVLMGWIGRQNGAYDTARLFLAIGVLGGFTTFSAFSLDLFALLEKRDILAMGGYLGASLVGGVGVFVLGYMLVRAA